MIFYKKYIIIKLKVLSFNGYDSFMDDKINEVIEEIEDNSNNIIEKINFTSFDRASILVVIVYKELDLSDSLNQGLEYLVKCDSNNGEPTF